MARIFLEAGAATRPVPRGAGIKRTLTLPQVPESFIGICVENCEQKKCEQIAPVFDADFFTVCGSPLFFPQ